MYELSLPADDSDEQQDNVVIGPFPAPADDAVSPAQPDEPAEDAVSVWSVAAAEMLPRLEKLLDDMVVGDGLFGQRPASIAALARQYWFDPPQFVREAIALRVLYGLYGVPVILANVAAQTLLLIIRYPTLLAAVVVVGAVVYLVTFILA
ncbi:hypothetical protein [Nonomuraea cavernae]|uniref:Uncharacterized protein n=1 Tax=Nonomuraea cavernae TaxID=2045107 RepID=A0A918DGI1_9ACTN|nr:hypothetical protein [Nonomuraea cavernae]MCA2184608.1 hypothetical protein [Nonomuraea cavernae]GGO63277.1 hypothetical protein GCM10012289_09930 [Nonomuraea cavernae]